MDSTRNERPRIVFEFDSIEDRQAFFTATTLKLIDEYAGDDDTESPWRLVAEWHLGEGGGR